MTAINNAGHVIGTYVPYAGSTRGFFFWQYNYPSFIDVGDLGDASA